MSDLATAVTILKWIQKHYATLIPETATIREATFEEDTKRARDAVIELPNGKIIPVGYRCEMAGGGKKIKFRSVKEGRWTELDKIQSGDCCDWYLYAWRDKQGILTFALIDIKGMREAGWFEPNKIHDKFSWKHGQWDQFSGYIFRYLHWLHDDGFVLLDKTFERKKDVD